MSEVNLSYGQVGPINKGGPSIPILTAVPNRLGNMGEAIESQLHGRYYEAVYQGYRFNAANQALVTMTAALATAVTGLILSNPLTSKVNLSIGKVAFGSKVAQTTALIILAQMGFNGSTGVTHTTPGTIRPRFGSLKTGSDATVDTSATLPSAPWATDVLGSIGTGALTVEGQSKICIVDLEGDYLIPPGGYFLVSGDVASVATSMWLSYSWEEVPI